MSEGKNRAVIGILLLVFLFFIILVVFAAFTVSSLKDAQTLSFDDKDGKIAVVEVRGVILESKQIIEKLNKAFKAKDVKAIIVRLDTPGGAVAPVQEIYQEIRRIDKTKPVYASFASVAASGGYYIAAAARKIYSNPGTMVGSIGVIMPFVEMSELYKWAKIKPNPIKAGRYKDLGTNHRPMTEEERTILTDLLKDVHNQFIDDILKIRKEKIKVTREEFAEGQIFSGKKAFVLGLVDELAGLWQAGRAIHEELNISGEFGLRFIKDKKESKFWKLLDNIDEAASNIDFFSKRNIGPMYLSN